MRKTNLGNLFKITSGGTPSRSKLEYFDGGDIPWVKTGDLKEKYIREPLEKITQTGLANSSARIFPANTVIVAMYGATIGSCSILSFPTATNQACAAFLPNDEVNHEYLYYFIKNIKPHLVSIGQGGGQPNISATILKSVDILLPPIDDQIRIAHFLSKVEGLIAQRKQHLKQLDELLKSVFLEMFGDPVRNERGWDRPELKHFGKISTGNTPPRKDASNYSTKHIEWIKTDNISSDSMYITSAMEYLSVNGKKKGRVITDGALLVACIAGSVESIGRAALANRTVTFNQQINAIQPNEDVSPAYLYALFKISKAYIQNHASKGMKRILTKGDFEKITMIKPPFDLQEEFAVVVEKIEGIKARYQASLAELERLYGVLSQQAFKGELDLSRVTLPASTTPLPCYPKQHTLAGMTS